MRNSINERQFSDVFAYALTRMTLSQFRAAQSASRSEAIARLRPFHTHLFSPCGADWAMTWHSLANFRHWGSALSDFRQLKEPKIVPGLK
jgi:hypothetical protein